MKTIVSKAELATDAKLALVKAFRMANKRAGECRQIMMQDALPDEVRVQALQEFEAFCETLRDLTAKAETLNFKIWVNANGKTGHTYGKDYKPTPDSDNDVNVHEQLVRQQQQFMMQTLMPPICLN